MTNERQQVFIRCLWAIAILVYLYFNINIHMHESYVYSGSLEGFFDISEGHLGISPWLKEYSKFGIYHPDHPLLHLLGYVFKKALSFCNISMPAIDIVAFINTLTGIAGIVVFYRILLLFSEEKLFATLMSLALMFSDVYWFGSKSGEGYVSGQCFNLLAIYFVFRYIREKKMKYVFFQAISLGISMAFHSLFVFMLIPQFYIFYSPQKDLKNLIKISSIIFFIMLIFGLSFYIFPLYFHIGAKSLSEMIKVFLFYSDEMGVWTKSIQGPLDFIWKILLLPAISGVFHLSFGVMDGIGTISFIFRGILILLFIWALIQGLRIKSYENRFMNIWFFTYFIFTCFILFLPYDITYWTFLLPAFIFIIFFALKDVKIKMPIALSLVAILFLNNFLTDIFPKHQANKENYFFVNRIAYQVKDSDQMGIVIFDSFAESSYLNYYGIISAIKHNPLFDKMKIEVIIDNNDLDTKISSLSSQGKKFYILRNVTHQNDRLSEVERKIAQMNYHMTEDVELRHFYNPKLDKTSEFQHEKDWYDLGPVNQSWVIHLSRYEKLLTK